MPINVEVPKTVAFLCASREEGGVERIVPIGTAFFVGLPARTIPGATHWYLVTARHVVAAAEQVYVRTTTSAGLVDEPVTSWHMRASPAQDIAVAPVAHRTVWQHKHWPATDFLSDSDDRPYLGDNVYFIGLLSFIPEMGERNVPMVRSGTLGAMYQEGIPVQMPDLVKARMSGHLIDCRAYRGSSGSPCFVQNPTGVTRLLGVIRAHFDASAELRIAGDHASVPIHAGIGVVAPVDLLNELLDDEVLAAERAAVEEAQVPPAADMLEPESD